MSIRRHGKGFQVRLAGFKARTFNTGHPADDRKAARRYQAKLLRLQAGAEFYDATPQTFGEALEGYMRRRRTQANWRAQTEKRKRETARKLASLYPLTLYPLKLPALSLSLVEDLILEIAAQAPNEAGKALGLVKSVLRDAESRGQRVDGRIYLLKPPRYEPREPRFLTLAELRELRSWMPEPVRRLVHVAGLTGMRQGELLALEERNLCLSGCDEEPEPHLHVRSGKTKAAKRRVLLVTEAVTALKEQLLVREKGTSLVFPSVEGVGLNRNNLMARYFRPAAIAAGAGAWTASGGYQGLTFHDLRHSFVSIAASSGWSFEHVGRQVGWSRETAARMFALYRHLFDGEMSVQLAKLEAFVEAEARGA